MFPPGHRAVETMVLLMLVVSHAFFDETIFYRQRLDFILDLIPILILMKSTRSCSACGVTQFVWKCSALKNG